MKKLNPFSLSHSAFCLHPGVVQRRAVVAGEAVDAAQGLGGGEDITHLCHLDIFRIEFNADSGF